ncbi:putative Malectin-like domain, leucine-rich repeat domain superfamily [Helianthus annuus]|uniref:Malectin-like domain, leucine-rich repeat domain superfamily n=2 Tax=Helianthus annuus TaxID=4232 RepID=A0A251U7D7_HELAN|nr:putative Malectin-like domain, leucine-rich repeat domain superfamily [Helianthus annuus]KAJ0539446.1 putative Malectin-like domain, leucine-rich repeat domain superfamily [Helianthus annuus]KAJ0554141.1 putative Malectin-like domain, leucine-rich repeat domain superfamily [Helianthus annuus]KAJ0719747.1 putative Malectin-like domain, leucine-rich repeat domain superfamily [Helianthus annuus]KAJ0722969.1 putative Malectin-like domain, leucine-rich repeat domain superfamily [Helianthus annuus
MSKSTVRYVINPPTSFGHFITFLLSIAHPMDNHLWLLAPLLALCIMSVSSKVFVSIDCGASGSFIDENSIEWKGDNDLISSGVAHAVQPNYSVSRVMNTLRVFTTRKKNCYSIKVEEGEKVLVRAGFNYGNYDNKSAPPNFDLLFDGNFWITVNASELKIFEIVYVVKKKDISVCVAQTNPREFPFISTLEVRSLDSQLYSKFGTNHALLLQSRFGYALNQTIRFPLDPYDRMWVPARTTNLVHLTSDASIINVKVPDNPPQAVLKNAVATQNTSQFINLGFNVVDDPFRYPAYINWYFSEVRELNSSELRSFRIFKDNLPFSLPIVPRFGEVVEYFISNLSLTTETNFSLNPLDDSTLPPLINAAELFSIRDALSNGTNNNDVEGLASLQNAFIVLQQWSGDPCLPAPYSWEWIKCSGDYIPRVTSINLNGFNLTGPLPDFSKMDALETIDLHNNSLSGPIPKFLGTLPNLKQLNLSDNQFTGSIPRWLSRNSKLNSTYTGNPVLCVNGKSCPGSGNNKTPIILGVTIPTVFILAIAVVLVVRHRRRKASVPSHSGGTSSLSGGMQGTNKGVVELNRNSEERFYRSPTPLLSEG